MAVTAASSAGSIQLVDASKGDKKPARWALDPNKPDQDEGLGPGSKLRVALAKQRAWVRMPRVVVPRNSLQEVSGK